MIGRFAIITCMIAAFFILLSLTLHVATAFGWTWTGKYYGNHYMAGVTGKNMETGDPVRVQVERHTDKFRVLSIYFSDLPDEMAVQDRVKIAVAVDGVTLFLGEGSIVMSQGGNMGVAARITEALVAHLQHGHEVAIAVKKGSTLLGAYKASLDGSHEALRPAVGQYM